MVAGLGVLAALPWIHGRSCQRPFWVVLAPGASPLPCGWGCATTCPLERECPLRVGISPAAGILPWCPPPELAESTGWWRSPRCEIQWSGRRSWWFARSTLRANARCLVIFLEPLVSLPSQQPPLTSASLPWPCAVRRARAAGPLRGPLARHRGSLCGCHPGTAAVIAAIVRDRRAFGESCLSMLGSSTAQGVAECWDVHSGFAATGCVFSFGDVDCRGGVM